MAGNARERAAVAEDGRPLFLYERMSRQLLRQIGDGTWLDGDKLPSVRRMSQMFGVSVNTVMQCYHKLEADGVIDVRPQSGFFVRSRATDKPAPAARVPLLPVEVSLSERVLHYMELHAAPDMVRLGIALPAAEILNVERVLKTLSDVLRHRPLEAWGYTHPNGHESLLPHLARRSLAHDVPITADDILVTSGCMEALTIALRCVSRPGDTIAIESPSYYGTLLMLEAHNRRVLEIPTSPRDGIRLDMLERAFAERRVAACLFSANAQNPMGFTMPRDNKARIAALAARYEVPLIENDIWGDTVYDAADATPAKAFDRQGLIIYCNSFSKTLIPGFRLGWAVPGRFQRRFREIKQLSTITSASAPQIAIARLLESGFYDHHIAALRRHLRGQAGDSAAEIERHFPTGTRVDFPTGGCVLWIRLPPNVNAVALFDRAAAVGIHVFPGSVFSPTGGLDNYLRINVGYPVDTRIRDALRTLGRIAHKLSGGGRRANT